MGNYLSMFMPSGQEIPQGVIDSNSSSCGHHECEVRARRQGSVEGGFEWDHCTKNPGHKEFFSVEGFTNEQLLGKLNSEEYEIFRTHVDRTVRVRVQWISRDRPDDDDLSEDRGTDRFRLGTGYIIGFITSEPSEKPCPCRKCKGIVVKKHWVLSILTARHVVYNTEEAKHSRVDLFYDEEDCRSDGRMKTVWPVDVALSNPNSDVCQVFCVTHEEDLAERIKSIQLSWLYIRDYYLPLNSEIGKLLDNCRRGRVPKCHFFAMIISHPHGQPKKISVGEWLGNATSPVSVTDSRKRYLTATCPGCSGAPVLLLYPHIVHPSLFLWRRSVHSGTFHNSSTQFVEPLNYGSSLRHGF